MSKQICLLLLTTLIIGCTATEPATEINTEPVVDAEASIEVETPSETAVNPDSETTHVQENKKTLGEVTDGRYQNESFAISFAVPQGWQIQNEEIFGKQQLRLTLEDSQNPSSVISLYMPPLETGFPSVEDREPLYVTIPGFSRDLNRTYFVPDTGRVFTSNHFYKEELDWDTYLGFGLGADSEAEFKKLVPLYQNLLNSVTFQADNS